MLIGFTFKKSAHVFSEIQVKVIKICNSKELEIFVTRKIWETSFSLYMSIDFDKAGTPIENSSILARVLRNHSFLQGWNPPFSERTLLFLGTPSFWTNKKLPLFFWEPSKLVHVNCKKHFKVKVLRSVLY